jgi:predicted nucleotidyltransferase
MLQRTAGWLRQSRADLESAEVLLHGGRFYMMSWSAQQSAEKALNPALRRFAMRLYDEFGVGRVLLFGSHARDGAAPDSDYDLILVSNHFRGVPRAKRQIGLRRRFYDVGGHAPMDLICLTPEEFEEAARRDTLIAAVLPHSIDLLHEPTPATL